MYSYVFMTDLLLNRKFNQRNIRLDDDVSRETVGYLCQDGSHRYVYWLGFIERGEARARQGAIPVRLVDISRIGAQGPVSTSWQDISENRYVQGCLTEGGVYGVYEQSVVLVDAPIAKVPGIAKPL